MVDAEEEEMRLGLKKGASAPYLIASFWYSSESVDTKTLSILLFSFNARNGQVKRGCPLKFKTFLFFRPLEPYRAGTIPNILCLLIIKKI